MHKLWIKQRSSFQNSFLVLTNPDIMSLHGHHVLSHLVLWWVSWVFLRFFTLWDKELGFLGRPCFWCTFRDRNVRFSGLAFSVWLLTPCMPDLAPPTQTRCISTGLDINLFWDLSCRTSEGNFHLSEMKIHLPKFFYLVLIGIVFCSYNCV